MNGKRVLLGAAIVAALAMAYRTHRTTSTDDGDSDGIDRIDTSGDGATDESGASVETGDESDGSSDTPASAPGTTQG